ncbi:MAG: ATP:cob(I)alamin adenosyltransferase [Planctomycetia bacterium TMED53]|nr:MAG: ATP:cob(I)alamin adenosyltransferase [Planctomycetia bacterium TMED53]
MNSIATGGGDEGDTGVLGSGRLPKNHSRIEAYGSVDELNSELGVILAAGNSPYASEDTLLPDQIRQQLQEIQSLLFDLGSDLAQPGSGQSDGPDTRINSTHSDKLTQWIHDWESTLPPLRQFIIPGGSLNAALLHRARTVCRRAERNIVRFLKDAAEGHAALVFLNRLSDLLFLQARAANQAEGIEDVPWISGAQSPEN